VERHHRPWPEQLVEHPWPMYAAMLIAFYLGVISFTVAAILRL
jgi:hypothetical protein